MPQNDSPAVMNAPASDNDAALDAALEKAGVSAKDAAAAEERAMAERLRAARQNEADARELNAEPEMLVSVAAQGRETLLQKLREHRAKVEAKPVYVPPPRTARQQEALEAELEAGRRAQAKHQEQWDSRPQPKPDPREGSSAPVFRPGSLVPDPTRTVNDGMRGAKTYSPQA